MLTEDLRILAGLQETKSVENALPKLIEEEQTQLLKEKQRIIDEQKTVVTHFNVFKDKMEKYNLMIERVMTLFNDKNQKEFIDGLFETKYSNLQKFADVVINDSLYTMMHHLEKNYYHLKEELEKIEYLVETDNESIGKDYFVSDTIFSKDTKHNLYIRLFKHKDLSEKILNEIPYGSQIISLSENLAVVKASGKKYYTPLSPTQLLELEKKGFLI